MAVVNAGAYELLCLFIYRKTLRYTSTPLERHSTCALPRRSLFTIRRALLPPRDIVSAVGWHFVKDRKDARSRSPSLLSVLAVETSRTVRPMLMPCSHDNIGLGGNRQGHGARNTPTSIAQRPLCTAANDCRVISLYVYCTH